MGDLPQLPDAELAVMALLWESEAMTARQIRERLYPADTRTNHGTVQKLLQRLEQKGYVSRNRAEFVHQFRAKISRAEYAGAQLEDLASKVTLGGLVPFFSHLIDNERVPESELRQLRELLDRYADPDEAEGE